MDPISQGALGALAATAFSSDKRTRAATMVGWVGGMLADADIFIRSGSDPLLNIEYHRHFSHSLIFIPVGGLICAGLLWLIGRKWIGFRELLLYSTLGYATAGLLDACTSYGTRLFWPFSEVRVAWNMISVIDPLFTGTTLLGLFYGFARRKRMASRIGLGFVCVYLLFGFVQNRRAFNTLEGLAEERGHIDAQRLSVKPSIGNLVVWRGIYQYGSVLYVDAIRVSPFGSKARVYEGGRIKRVDIKALKSRLPENSELSRDLDRFAHFSDGYLGWHPDEPDVIGDARYAMLPDSDVPLWGIRVDESKPEEHIPFLNFREPDPSAMARLWDMIRGR